MPGSRGRAAAPTRRGTHDRWGRVRRRGHRCREVSAHLGGGSHRRIKSPGCRGFSSLVQPLPTLATPVIRKAERHPAATGGAEERPECWQDVGRLKALERGDGWIRRRPTWLATEGLVGVLAAVQVFAAAQLAYGGSARRDLRIDPHRLSRYGLGEVWVHPRTRRSAAGSGCRVVRSCTLRHPVADATLVGDSGEVVRVLAQVAAQPPHGGSHGTRAACSYLGP